MAQAPDILNVSLFGKESIHCGFHLIPYIVHTVTTTLPSSIYVLITDINVAGFYLKSFVDEFGKAGTKARFITHVIPSGETSKSREVKADIEDLLLSHRCTRDTVVLALGGGVIGDLVGFVAATFMRGVRYVQIPTTLLAMVDSSVGGKTAIDTPLGKNLIGAFWQPEYVFIDAAFLETLPQREFSNGMAEVVKTAAIWDETEFASLEGRSVEIFAAIQTPSHDFAGRTEATRSESQRTLLSVIVGSISVKAHIVSNDERETGLRNLVNFGHTIGHAIEAVLTPAMLHGECVSIGVILEAEVARNLGILNQVAVGRLARCLKGYNLPVSLNDPRVAAIPKSKDLQADTLLDIMKVDKKNSGNKKKVVLLKRIGKTYEEKATEVDDNVLRHALAAAVEVEAVSPEKSIDVSLTTPGSKSISNRALVLAALGRGTCRLKNLLHSDDTQVMMNALLELKGAGFAWEDGGETLVVTGGEGKLYVPAQGKEIYLGNAGTAARFLTTVCALACPTNPSATGETTIITGNARMKQRPIGPLVTALRGNGCAIKYRESEGCLPLSISPYTRLRGGNIELAASVSSQYVSSILLCAPYAQEPITLELVGGQVISQPYIDMTISMMQQFGITVTRRRDPATGQLLDVYDIPKGMYANPEVYSIESDASSATYPLAIAAIVGGKCTVENIGSASLQGDAGFAEGVLKRMGCTVHQDASNTSVQGPARGSLVGVEEIDMEVMTDAFLTASVLAAVAKGTTRIVGIANQRVKECNRIRAIIDELAKFGVECKELDDGLEITGRPIQDLKRGVRVHCYDDHRVAMAFSVLAAVVPNTILEEKRCVEKTWPNWWDDLKNKIGVNSRGIELTAASSAIAGGSNHAVNASVVIIGMRGSGKTFVSQIAAAELSWDFVDADEEFPVREGMTVRKFVDEKGWPAFREAETRLLHQLLEQHPTNTVISLGGGIVETLTAVEALKDYAQNKGPVVHISRELNEVVEYLGAETARPAYGEPIVDVYARRAPLFKECCTHEFLNNVGSPDGTDISTEQRRRTRDEIGRFFGHVTGVAPNLVAQAKGTRTYFLSLTYPDVRHAVPHLETLSAGVDALELRVDLLRSPDEFDGNFNQIPSPRYVADQLTSLRRATSLPIVFTVRSKSQGGAFPDDKVKEAIVLMNLALRLGVEYLDVEISLPYAEIQSLRSRKGASQLIASWHDWSGKMNWDGPVVKEKYSIASKLGDLVKIVGKAKSLHDNMRLYEFVQSAAKVPDSKPIIAINMGLEGQLSRILNETLTPVSHPALPFKAAPGQLAFKEVQEALHLIGQLPARRFFLFGTPISHSMSPTLHNTAFKVLGLPHKYDLLETTNVGQEIRAAITAPDFGGASVTIPFKLDVIHLLDKLTPAAEAIGAVNTIIPDKNILCGDNTDWLGIRELIKLHVPGTIHAALVIGAGGTARAAIHALHFLGAKKIYIYNRTRKNAEILCQAFPTANMYVLEKIEWVDGELPPNVIIGTVPATATTTEMDGQGIHLPVALFNYRDTPSVVIDMAYKPRETPLLKLAASVGGNWARVPGVQVLLEQGYAQFELWTGRRCPRTLVSNEVWAKHLENE